MAKTDDFAASIGAEPADDEDFAASIGAELDVPPPSGAEAEPSTGDAILRGAGQAVSLGHGDELTAGVGALYDVGEALLGLRGDIDLEDAYETRVNAIRKADKAAQEAHPVAYGGGQVAGGALLAAAPGLGFLNPAANATRAARIATAAGTGAITGAGTSDAELGSGEVLVDALKGGAVGGALQGGMDVVAPYAAKAAGWIGDKLDDVGAALKGAGERRAFKAAIGNQGKLYDEAERAGRINEIGRELLDDDIVTFGSSARTIADRAAAAKKETGKKIGGLLDEVDDAAAAAGQRTGTGIFPIAKNMDDFETGAFNAARPKPTARADGKAIAAQIRAYADEISAPNNEALVSGLLKQAKTFEKMGAIPLSEANRLKGMYRFDPGDPTTMSLGKEATNKINRLISDELEAAVGRSESLAVPAAAQQLDDVARTGTGPVVAGGPGQAVTKEAQAVAGDELNDVGRRQLYEQLKKKYGTMATAAKGAEKLANRFEKNRSTSLTDLGAGGLGLMALGPKGLLLGAANNQLRKRGSSMAAVGLDKIGDVLQSAPETFGRFAPQLQAAAARGGQSLAVTHFLLMSQDPEYRRQLLGDESK